jgi:hypothetical protein
MGRRPSPHKASIVNPAQRLKTEAPKPPTRNAATDNSTPMSTKGKRT